MKRILATVLTVIVLPFAAFGATYNFVTTNSNLKNMPHGYAVTWGLNNESSSTNSTQNPTDQGSGINGSLNNYTKLLNDINGVSGPKQVVTSATITLWDIYDWENEIVDPADALFINILGGLNSGITTKQFALGTSASDDWDNAKNPFIDNPGTAWDYNDILGLSWSGSPALAFNEADAVKPGSLLKSTNPDQLNPTLAGPIPAGVTWTDTNPDKDGNPDFNLVITLTGQNLALLTDLLDTDNSNGSPNIGFGFAAECHYYMDGVTFTLTTGNASTPPGVPDTGSTLVLLGVGVVAFIGSRWFKR
ncbi:MAG TPA: VPDSG-CTERM sorting domain-containing protein [Lacunisphaera sp.]|nr:VPDSG-CTERM sorting domain-containing protein [Lacunisphaera sp.]